MKNKKKNKAKEGSLVDSLLATEALSTVARVTEIISSSPKSFDDAIVLGVARACKTLKNVTSAWVQDQKIEIQDGAIRAYRVNLKVTFVLNE